MKTILTIALILGSATIIARGIQQRQDTNKEIVSAISSYHIADHEFVWSAGEGGLMEVMLGGLAVAKGKSDAVKSLGQKMIEDHSKANEELEMYARKKGIPYPSKLGEANQLLHDSIAALTGDDFDKAFTRQMVKDHQLIIELFEREASSGTDADLKKWAAAKLPTLREHLNHSITVEHHLTEE